MKDKTTLPVITKVTLTDEQRKSLRTLLGKKISFQEEKYKVIDLEVNEADKAFVLHTDRKPLFGTFKNIETFLADIDVLGEVGLQTAKGILDIDKASTFFSDRYHLNDLTTVMMDNISKLQAPGGEKFIPQANAIAAQAAQVLNVAKTEIAALNLLNK